MATSTPPTTTQTDVWRLFQCMRAMITSKVTRELAEATGLSESDHDVLSQFTDANTPVQAMTLRSALGWEKSRLSHQLRRMEERGLVARSVCAEDGRAVLVSLTDDGIAAACKARIAYNEAVQSYFTERLTDEQMQQLEAISRTLLTGPDPLAQG